MKSNQAQNLGRSYIFNDIIEFYINLRQIEVLIR